MTGSRASGAEIRRLRKIGIDQIREQMALAVDRVMAEGSLYDPDLAALALKQARGDTIEAIFLIRAYRTTLPRFGASRPIATGAMRCERRISAIFKDVPGGQVARSDLRLHAPFYWISNWQPKPRHPKGHSPRRRHSRGADDTPHVADILAREDLIQRENAAPDVHATPDLTRAPLTPAR